MPENLAQGWLPVTIALDRRPSLVPHAPVRWLEFGSAPLQEPFVNHSIERLRALTPPAREIDTDLETLIQVGQTLPRVQPAGFIFHISRCGSTLIANGLKTSGQAVVVSESSAITDLMLPEPASFGRYAKERWERIRREALHSILSLFSHYGTGETERLVIKFTSLNILSLPVIRSYFPDVPCVITVRDPAEVMVSTLRGGGWMSFKSSPEVARKIFGWPDDSDQMPDEEYAARVLGRYMASALDAIDDRCMVVDYEDLNEKRIRQIGEFFGLELPKAPEQINQVFQFYAKDPAQQAQYHDDRREKKKQMTPELRAAVQQWAKAPYNDLRSR